MPALLLLVLFNLPRDLFRRIRSSGYLSNRYGVGLLSCCPAYFRDVRAAIDHYLLRPLTGNVSFLANCSPNDGGSIDDRGVVDNHARAMDRLMKSMGFNKNKSGGNDNDSVRR
jgi:hypothetical protein